MLHRGESLPATAASIPHTQSSKIYASAAYRRNARKGRNLQNNTATSANVGHRHRYGAALSPILTTTATRATRGPSSSLRNLSSTSFLRRNSTKKNALLVMSTLLLAFTGSALLPPASNTSNFLSSITPFNKHIIAYSSRTTTNTSPRRLSVRSTAAAAVDRGSGFLQGEVDVRIAVVAPLQDKSPLGPDWGTVLPHIAERLTWSDPGLQLRVINANNLAKEQQNVFAAVDAVVALGIKNEVIAENILASTKNINTFTALGSLDSLTNNARMAGVPVSPEDSSKLSGVSGIFSSVQAFFLPSARTAQRQSQAFATMRELYSRHTSDDLLFSFLVLVNEAARPVAAVSNSTKRSDAGFDAVSCMVSNCASEMVNCFTDTTCRTALDCMNACAFNDQVCSYRCIASYESPALQQFSLCIIQKHNCLGLAAEIPSYPNPAPMTSFQGEALTHELAEGLFVGWLDGAKTAISRENLGGVSSSGNSDKTPHLDPFSWRVFAGKNPAYDYFPCQFQLFYPGKAKGSFWYQPVFKVLTLDGQKVWRQRLYRVRRDKTPGTFVLSVLDNGVTSLEKWSIVDCDEGLDWCIFYYRGAASAAGMSYTGAVLASRSGDWPTDTKSLERIEVGLDRAGIKMWELSTVSNAECDAPPLNWIGPTATTTMAAAAAAAAASA
jgi:VDE lipocalin domain